MDAKLNHSDLSSLLAKEAGITVSKAELLTKAMFDLIIEGLEQDGIVKINGLGTFKLTDVASRSSVNVNTGEKFEIKGHKKLSFTPADALKDCVNQPFAMFEPVEVDETYSDDEDDNEETIVGENVLEEPVVEESANEEDAVEQVAAEAEAPEKSIEQPRPEPVLVHVPKKEKKAFVAPEKREKKSYKTLYITLSIILLIVVAVLFAGYFTQLANEVESVAKVETLKETPVKSVTEQVVVEQNVAVVENEAVKEDTIVNVAVEETVEPGVYKFVVTEQLASLDLKDITLADTVMYEAVGEWTVHKVVANETLTRIALKHYGDKKLWPYIVKYNSLTRPDDLRKGMELRIPMLTPKK
ncbi:MAG: HU family DNA-binding protein [Bacteroidaceae bacterium]|nr:HU family DNA-binding protein [Bacteroidaceae bacterium]